MFPRWLCVPISFAAGCSGSKADDLGQETSSSSSSSSDPSATTALAVPAFHGASEVLGTRADGLDTPQDLAFDPEDPGTLWVVNRADDSVSRFSDAGTPDQASTHIVDPYALHFMEQVSSIAFGAPGTFATCQDSRNTYNGNAPANDFMGPTLWSSDPAVFGQSNPEAVEYLSDLYGQFVDLGSHLDMLHETPDCVGIAWESDNVYWVFDGLHGAIARVDFREDHGPGFDDHSDGIVERWVEGEVSRVAGVVSHLVYDDDSGLLYIADTGNQRIAVLDTTTGQLGRTLSAKEPGTQHVAWEGASIETLLDGPAFGIEQPAGIERLGDLLLVTDAATGAIVAFDLDGAEVDRIETGRPGLAGIVARDTREIWLVDRESDELVRLLGE